MDSLDLKTPNINELAKQITKFSNREIKHSSALEITSRMFGYENYSDYSKYKKAMDSLEETIFKEAHKTLFPKWKEWLSKKTKYDDTDEKKDDEKQAYRSYTYSLFLDLEIYYRFKDGSKISLESDYPYDIYIQKTLLDIGMDRGWCDESDEVFDILEEKQIVSKFPLDAEIIENNLKKLTPLDFMKWIIKVCDLVINSNSNDDYRFLDTEIKTDMPESFVDTRLPVSSEITTEESFKPFLSVSIQGQSFSEIEKAIYELDFSIPSKKLKLRLTYKTEIDFHLSNIERAGYEEDINEIKDYGCTFSKTLEVLLQREYEDLDGNPLLYFWSIGKSDYLPFFNLQMIQIQDIEKEFERSIKTDIKRGVFIGHSDEAFDYCSDTLLSSSSTQAIIEQNDRCIRLMKEKNLLKYEQIMSLLEHITERDRKCFREEELYEGGLRETTHGTDICGSAIRYMLSCIDKTLPSLIYIKSAEYIARSFSDMLCYVEGDKTEWSTMAWKEHTDENGEAYINFEETIV
jgi:hypothetical protein